MKNIILCLLILVPAIAFTMGERIPETFIAEKDEFFLDKTGNATQMKERLAYLVSKYDLAGIDMILRRDNPNVKFKVRENQGFEYYMYTIADDSLFWNKFWNYTYGATLILKNKKIADFGCSSGRVGGL